MPVATSSRSRRFNFHPLTPARWKDLETLFGPRGACAGCWCMWWRLSRSQFTSGKGEGNRRALEALVRSGQVPGILAYDGDAPIGWCSVEPRESFPGLDRSRVLKRVDENPVWSIACLFVARAHRGKGVALALLEAAVAHARANGARLIEGYPVEPRKGRLPEAFIWTGTAELFLRAGFHEVLRRSAVRPIMRRAVRPGSARRSASIQLAAVPRRRDPKWKT